MSKSKEKVPSLLSEWFNKRFSKKDARVVTIAEIRNFSLYNKDFRVIFSNEHITDYEMKPTNIEEIKERYNKENKDLLAKEDLYYIRNEKALKNLRRAMRGSLTFLGSSILCIVVAKLSNPIGLSNETANLLSSFMELLAVPAVALAVWHTVEENLLKTVGFTTTKKISQIKSDLIKLDEGTVYHLKKELESKTSEKDIKDNPERQFQYSQTMSPGIIDNKAEQTMKNNGGSQKKKGGLSSYKKPAD